MKTGDKVIFIGCDDDQVKWGSNDDPRKHMKEGDLLIISAVEVHSWHTKLSFVGVPGKYNSVSFKATKQLKRERNKVIALENCKSYLENFKHEWKEGEEMLYAQIVNALNL